MAKLRAIKVETIFPVEVVYESDLRFTGEIELSAKKLGWTMDLDRSMEVLNIAMRTGDPVLMLAVMASCHLVITIPGKNAPQSLLDDLKFQLLIPVLTAIGLFLDRRNKDQRSRFTIPMIAAEEMGQFKSPGEIEAYVLSLNQ